MRKNSWYLRFPLLSITIASAPAWAQSVEEGAAIDELAIGEIVVTAQGRAQRLQDVPVAVSVATGEDITRANLGNIDEVTKRMPAVNISPAPGGDFVTIRGVGSSLNLGFEQSVGTFVDGVYRGRARATRSALFDIERLEVLKGPQTTFFGNNTIAGALNITTRKPGSDLEVNAQAFYAPNFGEYLAEAGISAPLTDNLSVRLAGRLSGMDGFIRNTITGDKAPDNDDRIGRLAFRWTPSSTVTMDARIDYGENNNKGAGSYELLSCAPPAAIGLAQGPCARYLAANGGVVDDRLDRRSANSFSVSLYKYTEAELKTEIEVGLNSLTLTSGYFWHNAYVSGDALPIPPDQGGSVIPGARHTILVDTTERFKQYSQEVRFASPDEGFVSYMVGGYLAHTKLDVDLFQTVYFAPVGGLSGGEYTAATPVVGKSTNREEADILSAFAAATVRPTDLLRVNLGLRYSTVKKDAFRTAEVGTTNLAFPTDATFIPGNALTQARLIPVIGYVPGNFVDPKRRDSKLMPSISVQYDITPDAMGYISYTKGFKAGGFATFGQSNSSFDPENVDAYEAGIKASLFDRKLVLNIAGFYGKYKNLQEAATVIVNGNPAQIVGNVASSSSKGIELGASLRPFDGFTLSTDITYLDSKYLSFPGAPCTAAQKLARPVGCVQDLSNKGRAFAPKWSGNVRARYETDISDALKLSMDGTMYFSSMFFQQVVADPFLAQQGFAKLDARIALGSADGLWEFAVVGRNLTDKQTASFRQGIAGTTNSFQALADMPRSVGFQATLRY